MRRHRRQNVRPVVPMAPREPFDWAPMYRLKYAVLLGVILWGISMLPKSENCVTQERIDYGVQRYMAEHPLHQESFVVALVRDRFRGLPVCRTP